MTKLAKIEDWKAPWEKDLKDGDEAKIDPDQLKKYLHGLLSDKEKAQERLTEAGTELETFKTAATEAARKGESADAKRDRELAEANARADKAEKAASEVIRLRVALTKGLTESQAKRLQGETEEELSADADDYLKDLKPAGEAEDDGDDDDDADEAQLRQTPIKKGVRSGGDPLGQLDTYDPVKHAAEGWGSNHILG